MPGGRPKKNVYDRPERKTIYFDRQTSWELLQFAGRLNRSVSEVVNTVIRDFLQRAKDATSPAHSLMSENTKPRVGMHSKHTEIGDKQWDNHNRKVAARRRQAKSNAEKQRYEERRNAWQEGFETGRKRNDQ